MGIKVQRKCTNPLSMVNYVSRVCCTASYLNQTVLLSELIFIFSSCLSRSVCWATVLLGDARTPLQFIIQQLFKLFRHEYAAIMSARIVSALLSIRRLVQSVSEFSWNPVVCSYYGTSFTCFLSHKLIQTFLPEFLWPRGKPFRVHQPHRDSPPADNAGHPGGDCLLKHSSPPLRATHMQRLPPPGGTTSFTASCRTLMEGGEEDKNRAWSKDSAMLCHTPRSEALMGIKELSAGLISTLCHPALYCNGRVSSSVPDAVGSESPHTKKIRDRVGQLPMKGTHPCAAYPCNKHIHTSLTAKWTVQNWFQTACVNLTCALCWCICWTAVLYCCTCVPFVSLSAGPACHKAQVRNQTSNVRTEHVVV